MDITELTVHELQDKLAKKEITVLDITKAYLQNIEEKEDDIKAFVTILKDEALKQAEEVQGKIDKGRN